MTKYVVNSGGIRKNPVKEKEFFTEVIKGLGKSPNILFCMFAKAREDWEEKFIEYQKGFKNAISDKINPVFQLALPDIFVAQVNKADAIIIYGGDDHLVQYWLKQYDIPKIWQGKTIATSSAGSDVLVQHYWTSDWRQCMDGLGILPIKFIPHYQSDYGAGNAEGPIDWEKAYNKLEEYGDKSLPIHALKEGDFIVIEN